MFLEHEATLVVVTKEALEMVLRMEDWEVVDMLMAKEADNDNVAQVFCEFPYYDTALDLDAEPRNYGSYSMTDEPEPYDPFVDNSGDPNLHRLPGQYWSNA